MVRLPLTTWGGLRVISRGSALGRLRFVAAARRGEVDFLAHLEPFEDLHEVVVALARLDLSLLRALILLHVADRLALFVHDGLDRHHQHVGKDLGDDLDARRHAADHALVVPARLDHAVEHLGAGLIPLDAIARQVRELDQLTGNREPRDRFDAERRLAADLELAAVFLGDGDVDLERGEVRDRHERVATVPLGADLHAVVVVVALVRVAVHDEAVNRRLEVALLDLLVGRLDLALEALDLVLDLGDLRLLLEDRALRLRLRLLQVQRRVLDGLGLAPQALGVIVCAVRLALGQRVVQRLLQRVVALLGDADLALQVLLLHLLDEQLPVHLPLGFGKRLGGGAELRADLVGRRFKVAQLLRPLRFDVHLLPVLRFVQLRRRKLDRAHDGLLLDLERFFGDRQPASGGLQFAVARLEVVFVRLLVERDEQVALLDRRAFGGEERDLRAAAQLGEDAVVLHRAELAVLRDDDLQLALLSGEELDGVRLGAERPGAGALPLRVKRRPVDDRRGNPAADHAQHGQPLDRFSELRHRRPLRSTGILPVFFALKTRAGCPCYALLVVDPHIYPWLGLYRIGPIPLRHAKPRRCVKHLHPFARAVDARLVGAAFLQDIYPQEEDQLRAVFRISAALEQPTDDGDVGQNRNPANRLARLVLEQSADREDLAVFQGQDRGHVTDGDDRVGRDLVRRRCEPGYRRDFRVDLDAGRIVGDLLEQDAELDADALELRVLRDRPAGHQRALNGNFRTRDDTRFGAGADDQVGRRQDLRLPARDEQPDERVEIVIAVCPEAQVAQEALPKRGRALRGVEVPARTRLEERIAADAR